MKKRSFKILGIGLMSVLIGSFLAGCSDANVNTNTNKPDTEASEPGTNPNESATTESTKTEAPEGSETTAPEGSETTAPEGSETTAPETTEPEITETETGSTEAPEKEVYKISFYDEDGVTLLSELDVEEGGEITIPTVENKEDDLYIYEFSGFDKEVPEAATENMSFKAVYKKVIKTYLYTLELKDDALIIKGQVNPKYAGMEITISWEFPGAEVQPVDKAMISETAEFEIKVDLLELSLNHQGFAHVTITDKDGNIAHGGEKENLGINRNQTPLEDGAIDGTNISHSISLEASNGAKYYAGNAWDGLMLYGVDLSVSYEVSGVRLENRDNNIYYVVAGKYTGNASKLKLAFDLQHDDQVGHLGWEYVLSNTLMDVKVNKDTNEFTAEFNATKLAGESFKKSLNGLWGLIVHFGLDGSLKDIKGITPATETFVVDGIEYSILQNGSTFDTPALVLKTDNVPTYESATLANVDGRAIVTIKGKYSGDPTVFEKMIAEYNPVYSQDRWDLEWTRYDIPTTFDVADGVLTITIDITELGIGGYKAMLQLPGKNPVDFKISNGASEALTIGDKTYRILSVPNSGDPKEFWAALGLIVE